MLDISQEMRVSYLEKLGIASHSISGQALLRGDWDDAPLFQMHCRDMLRSRPENGEG